VSPDWFDPLGLRGSKLDPFTMFRDALRGEGLAHQSAERMATNIAQRLVGRKIRVEGDLEISATVDAVEEVRPPTAVDVFPTGVAEAPMWSRVRGRLRDVTVGDWQATEVALTADDLVLVGATADRLRVGHVDFVATVESAEVERWAAEIDGDHRLRISENRIEVTDRRLERWVWLEVSVSAADRTITVEPRQLRLFGRPIPMVSWLKRAITRPAPWMPANVSIESVSVEGDQAILAGSVGTTLVPVDVAKVLTDLGTEGTMSVLRIVTGDW